MKDTVSDLPSIFEIKKPYFTILTFILIPNLLFTYMCGLMLVIGLLYWKKDQRCKALMLSYLMPSVLSQNFVLEKDPYWPHAHTH